MSKRTLLTLSDDLNLYVVESAKKMGVTKMDYIRYVIMKDEAEFKFIESRPEMVDAIADLLKEAAKVADRSALRGGQNE